MPHLFTWESSFFLLYIYVFFPFPGSQKPGLIGARGVHGGGDEEVTLAMAVRDFRFSFRLEMAARKDVDARDDEEVI